MAPSAKLLALLENATNRQPCKHAPVKYSDTWTDHHLVVWLLARFLKKKRQEL